MMWRYAFKFASPGGTRGRLSILIFHRVLAETDPLFPGEPSAAQFDKLCAHLRARFEVLPLSEAVTRLQQGSLPAGALAITFDDGYADNLSIAAPILRKHHLPATLFIATGYLDGGCMWNDKLIEAFRSTRNSEIDLRDLGLETYSVESIADRRAGIDRVIDATKYLSLAERDARADHVLRAAGATAPRKLMLDSTSVNTLASLGVDVGVHTVNHPILARTSSDQAWEEIVESKRRLEELTGKSMRLFAYPNGKPGQDYSREHVSMVQQAGFDAAVSTAWGPATRQSDIFQLPRFTPWAREPLKFDLLMMRNLRMAAEQHAA
jgi:peptidoglycan/xylan/chitin deacetylase (PgdA/CDA1 family)